MQKDQVIAIARSKGGTISPKDLGGGDSRAGYKIAKRMCEDGVLERVGHGKYRIKGETAVMKSGDQVRSPMNQLASVAMGNAIRFMSTQMATTDVPLMTEKIAASCDWLAGASWVGNYSAFAGPDIIFGGRRNVWLQLGYPQTGDIPFETYLTYYLRQDIAKRIVDAPAQATWRNPPTVQDDDGPEGPFAHAFARFARDLDLWARLAMADRRARIGRYGIIVMEAAGSPDTPLRAGPIIGIKSYTEGQAQIESLINNPRDRNHGRPEFYQVISGDATVRVHHSRVIHIAEDAVTDDIYGTPALQPVLNRLIDREKAIGGGAESVWRTFDRGLHFDFDIDSDARESDFEALESQALNYNHGFARILITKGVKATTLGSSSANPKPLIDVIDSTIAGAKGIPQRILFGSERGNLASTQDERNWNAQIKERQITFAEPSILRPLITKALSLRGATWFGGTIPKPNGMVRVIWPDLSELSDQEKLQNFKTLAQGLRNIQSMFGAKAGPPVMDKSEARHVINSILKRVFNIDIEGDDGNGDAGQPAV